MIQNLPSSKKGDENEFKNGKTPISLTNESKFCVKFSEGCATWKKNSNCKATSDKEIILLAEQTLFAVKTCKKYHSDRLPVIFETWSKAAVNIEYFSEVSDVKFGTTVFSSFNFSVFVRTSEVVEYVKGLVLEGGIVEIAFSYNSCCWCCFFRRICTLNNARRK